MMGEGRGFWQWSPRVSVSYDVTLFLDSMSVPWCKALHLWPWGRAPQTSRAPQAKSRKREEAGKAEYLPGSQLLCHSPVFRTQGLNPGLPSTWNWKLGRQVWLSVPFTPIDSPGRAFWSSGPGMNQSKAR